MHEIYCAFSLGSSVTLPSFKKISSDTFDLNAKKHSVSVYPKKLFEFSRENIFGSRKNEPTPCNIGHNFVSKIGKAYTLNFVGTWYKVGHMSP